MIISEKTKNDAKAMVMRELSGIKNHSKRRRAIAKARKYLLEQYEIEL
jgi:hypothetical protein